MHHHRLGVTTVALALSGLLVVGLGSVAEAKTSKVEVELTDAGCPKKLRAQAGKIRFDVTNVDTSAVTEFEVLKGDDILGEKENLTPGLSGHFTLTLKAGTYTTYCPGGDRERGKLIVTGKTNLEPTKAGECQPVGDTDTASTTVKVDLDEWTILPDVPSVPAGRVAFVAENVGKENHELVIVRGVSSADLPRKKNGSLNEAKLPPGALVGEIEQFAPGETCEGVFDLAPGDYRLLCNVVEKHHGDHQAHLKEGMINVFTVT